MELTSSQFSNNAVIPREYTCTGQNINPPLTIQGVPSGAKSLVLIVDDPDAPHGTFVHWVVYDMPVMSHIEEESVPGTVGMNDFGNTAYGGPCPPSGTHHYHFKLYALDAKLDLPAGQTKIQIERAMRGHIIADAELVGLFTKEFKFVGG